MTDSTREDQGRNEDDMRQYLTFRLHDELYGIDILRVREIIEYGKVTPVPRMPDCVRGIINLRGSVVPVLDLGKRFTKVATEVTPKTCIVIAEIEEDGGIVEIGVIVDAVNEVSDIDDDDTEAPPSFGGRIRQDFIQKIGKLEDHFVIVLNVDKVLDIDELSALQSGLMRNEAAAA
ncbi:chemotaxis protein CheW [Algiphilus sp.]|uniref:chemotaxis protein CheW n=1 Tax=Algiphilus sp. TaxID=1872431 RepID=UPI003B52BB69